MLSNINSNVVAHSFDTGKKKCASFFKKAGSWIIEQLREVWAFLVDTKKTFVEECISLATLGIAKPFECAESIFIDEETEIIGKYCSKVSKSILKEVTVNCASEGLAMLAYGNATIVRRGYIHLVSSTVLSHLFDSKLSAKGIFSTRGLIQIFARGLMNFMHMPVFTGLEGVVNTPDRLLQKILARNNQYLCYSAVLGLMFMNRTQSVHKVLGNKPSEHTALENRSDPILFNRKLMAALHCMLRLFLTHSNISKRIPEMFIDAANEATRYVFSSFTLQKSKNTEGSLLGYDAEDVSVSPTIVSHVLNRTTVTEKIVDGFRVLVSALIASNILGFICSMISGEKK